LESEETVCGDNESIDLLEVPPVSLAPDACYYSTKPAYFDRCMISSYNVDLRASATDPITGLPPNCSDADEIELAWDEPS